MGRLSGLRHFGHVLGQHFSNLTPNMLPKAEEREHILLVDRGWVLGPQSGFLVYELVVPGTSFVYRIMCPKIVQLV